MHQSEPADGLPLVEVHPVVEEEEVGLEEDEEDVEGGAQGQEEVRAGGGLQVPLHLASHLDTAVDQTPDTEHWRRGRGRGGVGEGVEVEDRERVEM